MINPVVSFTRSTARRAVHLQLSPRLSSIGESREVLHLLSRFGEIEYFRNLRWSTRPSPNCALAIFQDEDAAQHCLNRSPIRFRLGRAPAHSDADTDVDSGSDDTSSLPDESHSSSVSTSFRPSPSPSSGPFGVGQTRHLSTRSLPEPQRDPLRFLEYATTPAGPSSASSNSSITSADVSPSEPDSGGRIFQIVAQPAEMDFVEHVYRTFYNGPFVINYRSAVSEDLAKRVPVPGMANIDWRREKQASELQRAKELGLRGHRSLREIYQEHIGREEEEADDNGPPRLRIQRS